METIDYSFGSFALTFRDGRHIWYFTIHPQMCSAWEGVTPTGNYFIYCMHPTRGSCHLILEQDRNCDWFSKHAPLCITMEILGWIGKHIENRCT